jgi:hypothetical protein
LTWPAALPGAALRILRTAAGRRALQGALLVGGLFALGFLCGGQASAAEGIPTATALTTLSAQAAPEDSAHSADPVDGVRSLASGVVGRLVKPQAEPGVHDTAPPSELEADDTDTDMGAGASTAPKGSALTDVLPASVDDQVLRPVTEHVVGVVDGKVLQPVGDLVETVTEQLAEVQEGLVSLPGLPTLPEEPSLPGLPELPTVPGLPALPGQTLPVTTAPQPESPVHVSPDGDGDGDGDGSGKRSGSGKETDTAAFYGPPSVAGSPATDAATQTDEHLAVQGAHAPVQQAPSGDTGGVPGSRSTADSGSSRHGDAQAVSLNHRAPLRLVAGAIARTDAFDTRDRHRDIPVSPA